jgi:hypothetical protein
VVAAFAVVPAQAGAAPVQDYSCDIASLQVNEEFDNGSSGPFTASGTGECWTDDPQQKVSTTFSASGTYVAKKCNLISGVIPAYLTLSGNLTITPSGSSSMSTTVIIKTSDIVTANSSVGTISLGSGQDGAVTVDYDTSVLGFVARCGGNGFSPDYSGSFLAL